MKIAVCSDELYPVNDFVVEELRKSGYEPVLFGALRSRSNAPWIASTEEAAKAISSGDCQEGIFFCWTGTGTSIVANKIPGIRAALCTDAQTAAGSRIWNSANVLALSNRLLTQDLAKEILASWFNTALNEESEKAAAEIQAIESNYKTRPRTSQSLKKRKY